MQHTNVDLREFRAAYLAEVDEHLGAINGLLLAIETASRARKSSPRDLRELLRLLHTLKGLSAMVGIEPIVTLAHRMETVVRAADRAGSRLSARALEAIIDGTRAIEARVRAVANGLPVAEPTDDTLAALLDAIPDQTSAGEAGRAPPQTQTGARAPVADQDGGGDDDHNDRGSRALGGVTSNNNALDPQIAEKLTASELEQLAQGSIDGLRGVALEFAPTPAKAEQGQTITTVRERLVSLAEIVRVLPMSMPASEATPGGLVFTLILLTDASDDALAQAASIPTSDIRQIAPAIARSQPPPPPPPPPMLERDVDADDVEGVAQQEEEQQQLTTVEQGRRPLGVLRVEVGRIDDAIDKLSGLIVTRSRLSHAVAKLRHDLGVNTSNLEAILADNARQLRDLRGAILRVRMVPITAVLDRLPLVIRGLGRTTGKQVRLVLDEGGGAELDKTVAERIFPALVHILRNAVDHGIEDADERVRLGKPEQGTITVSSSSRNNRQIEIRIHDDGRGVDRTRIEAKARSNRQNKRSDGGYDSSRDSNESESRGGGGDGGEANSSATLIELVCRPGLSTRDEVDTLSGRGVGMDIVHKIVVDGLGGELSLETILGHGTTFVLRVPLTIAIVDAFAVICTDQRFVVPVPVVEEIIELDPSKIVHGPHAHGREIRFFSRRGETVPIIDLAHALGLSTKTSSSASSHGGGSSSSSNPSGRRQALVVRRGYDEPVAFAIDRILGQQETVVRPLIDPLVSVVGVAGSTDLGDGSATLVLDLLALCAKLGRETEYFAS